ncbi:hypothetical protein Y1Q_0001008 [Alligator mississippiensis]|uniref:Uncharacterized protein n=1 Tax=Alligator mississippiensis TaxID=8496 RepID=A0A151NEG0_ALLMI|nr:hypothetical protein Y1Q_0001008 [Alligator mississippiensis]
MIRPKGMAGVAAAEEQTLIFVLIPVRNEQILFSLFPKTSPAIVRGGEATLGTVTTAHSWGPVDALALPEADPGLHNPPELAGEGVRGPAGRSTGLAGRGHQPEGCTGPDGLGILGTAGGSAEEAERDPDQCSANHRL